MNDDLELTPEQLEAAANKYRQASGCGPLVSLNAIRSFMLCAMCISAVLEEEKGKEIGE